MSEPGSRREERRARAAAWLAPLLLSLACKSASPKAERGPQSAPDSSFAASSNSGTEPAALGWRQLVRRQRWSEAARAFDTAHPHPTQPLLRYARARLAQHLEQYERVIDLTNGLEARLPRFSAEVSAMRREAAEAGGADDWVLQTWKTPSSLEQAVPVARALKRRGDLEQAASVLDARLDARRDDLAVTARRLRIELAEAQGDARTAYQHWHWIALRAPTSPPGRQADERLAQLGKPLTAPERMRRVDVFSKAGDVAAVEGELARVPEASGTPPRRAEQLRALGWAHYHARSYQEAARLFEECAKLEAKHRAQDEFYAARALSRAHQDELAIARYRRLIRRFPRSRHVEQARFLTARLHYGLGQWKQASAAYASYLRSYGRRRTARVQLARSEQAIALLAGGRVEAAHEQLSALARRAPRARERATFQQLAGLAAARLGRTQEARQRFEQVIAERPLSLSALLAGARLRQMEAELPPPIASEEQPKAAPAPLVLELPQKVEVLREFGFHLDAERELASQAGGYRKRYAPRGGEALCEAYAQLDPARERYRFGVQVVRERAVMRAVTPATRWLWDCLYPQPYPSIVGEVEQRYQLPRGLIHAVMRQESAFATTVRSPVGAIGLMQLIEPTARQVAAELGLPFELDMLERPAYNIELGGFYLAKLLKRFDGNVLLAASAYNAGPRATLRWLQSSVELPLDLFAARILYTETRNYVRRVVGNWARYQYLRGGLKQVPQLKLELPEVAGPRDDDY